VLQCAVCGMSNFRDDDRAEVDYVRLFCDIRFLVRHAISSCVTFFNVCL
jgi:hypothetical protein